jgi:hypothetical protein
MPAAGSLVRRNIDLSGLHNRYTISICNPRQ